MSCTELLQSSWRWAYHRVMRGSADTVKFWRPVGWPGIELMKAHWVQHSFAKHFHDCYTLGINHSGCGVFDCGGSKHQANPGTLNLIAPGETHTGRAAQSHGWLYRDFYVDRECMIDLVHQAGGRGAPEFPSAVIEDPELARRFRFAFDLLAGSASNRLEQEYHLLLAVRRLIERHTTFSPHIEPERTAHRSKINAIREYLDAHYEQNVSANDLAKLAGWSCYYLIRTFHRETGIPPHAYQNVVRVNEARRLLRGGTPIADVALAVGFYDQSHMHHLFRRVAGATPGQYKRQRAISSKT